jgi:hypothetical protein
LDGPGETVGKIACWQIEEDRYGEPNLFVVGGGGSPVEFPRETELGIVDKELSA